MLRCLFRFFLSHSYELFSQFDKLIILSQGEVSRVSHVMCHVSCRVGVMCNVSHASSVIRSNRSVTCFLYLSSRCHDTALTFIFSFFGNQIAYWGPRDQATKYFSELGFDCPDTYNVAEFLAEVVDHPDKFPPKNDTSVMSLQGDGGKRIKNREKKHG